VQAADTVVKRRLKARELQADVVSDARLEDYDVLTGLYQAPKELKGSLCVAVQTVTSPEHTVARALARLAQAQLGRRDRSP
jgi:hypothetical protein